MWYYIVRGINMNRLRIAVGAVSFILAIFCLAAPSFAAERFVINYDKKLDVTEAPVTIEQGGYNIKLDMSRPARPFSEIVFRVFIEKDGKPVNISQGHMLFNMSMDMGLYKANLQKASKGYTAKVTLPKCIMGGKVWYGKLSFGHEGGQVEKVFLFNIKD